MQDYIAVFCVFVSSLLGAFGSFFFKKANTELSLSLKIIIQNYALFLGFSLFGLSSLVYLFALNLSKLTVIYPISSFSYVWSLFIGRYLLQEKITLLKIFGIIFIITGITIIVTSI